MPALHFSTRRVLRERPTPLLLTSVLYAASIQHPLNTYANSAPTYLRAATAALGRLAIHSGHFDPVDDEMGAMQDVWAMILLGLLSEGWANETGLWISMAYSIYLAQSIRLESHRSSGLERTVRRIESECYTNHTTERP